MDQCLGYVTVRCDDVVAHLDRTMAPELHALDDW